MKRPRWIREWYDGMHTVSRWRGWRWIANASLAPGSPAYEQLRSETHRPTH